MSGITIRLREPYREIDGGMVGHVEEQNLRRAEEERGLDPRRLRRRTVLEHAGDQMAQRAEPANDGRDQRPRQRAVAVGERGKSRMGAGAVELVVERAAAAQHRLEDIGGDAPGGEALHLRAVVGPASVGFVAGWSLRLARGFHRAFLVPAPYIPRVPSCHTKSPSRKVEPMPNDPQTLHPPADAPESVAERPR